MNILLTFSLFLSYTVALRFSPEPTLTITPAYNGLRTVPLPTKGPSVAELRKRDLIGAIPGLLVAPDETCGYELGFSGERNRCCSSS
jgi:hypothetical protein